MSWVLREGLLEETADSGRTGGFRPLVLVEGGMRRPLAAPSQNLLLPQESVNRLHAQMQAFVSESQRAAELEEKRRYRFLAEKHLLLSNTFLQFFGRVSGGRGDSQRSLPRVCGLCELAAHGDFPPFAHSLLSFFSVHIYCLLSPSISLVVYLYLQIFIWLFLHDFIYSHIHSLIHAFIHSRMNHLFPSFLLA